MIAPDLQFSGQPFAESDTAGAFLSRAAEDDSMTRVTIAVAWARFGGLARIEPWVSALRGRGGTAEILVGIDEGVATRPGLRKAISLFDRVSVVFDPVGRTFHPKVYLVEGSASAVLLVGSSNATAGGLFFNFEASLRASFQLPDEDEHPALVKCREYLDALRSDAAICLELTEDRLDQLLADPRYPIAETERRSRRGRPGSEAPDGDESDRTDGSVDDNDLGVPLFQASQEPRPAFPPLSAAAREELTQLEGEADVPADEAEVSEEEEAAFEDGEPPTVVNAWSKELGHADAQQPVNPATNPIGNLRLTESGHDINHRRWFRDTLFGPADWRQTHDTSGNQIEEAIVPIAVVIGGVDLGQMLLRLTHAPHREAGQGNVPTVLHWGPELNRLLRSTDYSGHIVRIERFDDGGYRLSIAQ